LVRIWKVGGWPGIGRKNTPQNKKQYIAIALDKCFAAIGSAEVPDLSRLSVSQIADYKGVRAAEWYRFGHDIKQGHIVMLYDNSSRQRVAYVGVVTAPPRDLAKPNSQPGAAYYHVPEHHRLNYFRNIDRVNYAPHRVNVRWIRGKKRPVEVVIDWQDTLHEVRDRDIRTTRRPKNRKGRPQGLWLSSDPDFASQLRRWLAGDESGPYLETGERRGLTTHRIGQGKVRESARTRYGDKCALCPINLPSLLVAGHIHGWADNERTRGQDSNVVLMCSLHDALFGKGLIALRHHKGTYAVEYSPQIKQPAYREWFSRIKSEKFTKPSTGAPAPEFLNWHYENIFVREV
jgi:hypothetical protein